ncbi:uncharacterized protein EKO05_0008473 [Ascochyta rabiei]|uniref:uncharacterized protein n=1 Tax=Didymella rabiei TaxID=5454 RepID=UPI0022069309|nr:uncharacterized protein EKO05_0008473 [Ascochyta rabiei]UPX18164.1 hypothetical protein EKO05_0008473 [Ascochyta rabiei]
MLRLLLTSVVAAVVSAKCYEPTFAHPLPEYDVGDALPAHAFAELNTAITSAVAAPEFAATSFSIAITSSKQTLWSKHHTARERNASRPDIAEVNGDALYRIASITKTFTVLGVLYQEKAGNLSLDEPIDKYIVELKEAQNGTLPWKDITLRSLASQLSGIPRECAIPGLPWHGCQTLKDLLDALKSKIPIFAPNQQSTYSNAAFELLGMVLERVTGQSYRSFIEEAVFKPLNMSKSTLSLPPDSAGVIPLGPQYWDVDEGIQSPTGGIYSSSTDLSRYLRYVLTHFNGITHALNWFNPASPTRGLNSFYAVPWEIFHTDRALQNSRRTVRFITKGGGLPGYTSNIIIAPEYDLGITILVAGNPELLPKLRESVTEFVRPAEQLAIRQLNERYAGTYVSSDSSLNSSVTIVADQRGLVVTEFISNSTDFLHVGIVNEWIPRYGIAQLVPTLLYRNAKKQQGEEWRVQPVEQRDHQATHVWDDFCMTDIEGPLYAGVAINNFVFWDKSEDGGEYETLELSAFRANLTKVPRKRFLEEESMEL